MILVFFEDVLRRYYRKILDSAFENDCSVTSPMPSPALGDYLEPVPSGGDFDGGHGIGEDFFVDRTHEWRDGALPAAEGPVFRRLRTVALRDELLRDDAAGAQAASRRAASSEVFLRCSSVRLIRART